MAADASPATYKQGATGSSPVAPTTNTPSQRVVSDEERRESKGGLQLPHLFIVGPRSKPFGCVDHLR